MIPVGSGLYVLVACNALQPVQRASVYQVHRAEIVTYGVAGDCAVS